MSQVVVGRLVGVFGVRGEVKCALAAGAGHEQIAAGTAAVARGAGGERAVRVRTSRRHHDRLVVAFDGIETPEAARDIVGCELLVDRAAIPLGPGEYFDADLVGLRLVDEAGRELAWVVGVEHYPAQDCLVVEPGRALVPLVKAFVRRIDLARGTIVTALPAGLLE